MPLESAVRIACATTTILSALVWFVARRTRPVREGRLAFVALGAALWIDASLFMEALGDAAWITGSATALRVVAVCILFATLGLEIRRRQGRARRALSVTSLLVAASFVVDTVLHRARPPYLTLGTPALAVLSWTLVVILLRELLATDRAEASLEAQVRERSDALRRAKSDLVQVEKLASVGLIAAGVAHEINNPAAYALANLAGLRESLDALRAQRRALLAVAPSGDTPTRVTHEAAPGDALADDQLRDALDGLLRIRDIVAEVNSLAQNEPREPEAVSLPRVVEASAALALPTIRDRATLTLELAPVGPVLGHAGKLSQVVINLVVNAAEAMPDRGDRRGRIRVRTAPIEGHVALEVSDDGRGIPPEQLGEIFRPLHTTKRAGTGLGLAISRRIIEAHGGRIEVESVLGEGTTFRVLLPDAPPPMQPAAVPAAPRGAPPSPLTAASPRGAPPSPLTAATSPRTPRPAAAAPRAPAPPAASATAAPRVVMLIDDEALLVKVLSRFLARSHRVVTATSVDEALALVRGGTDPDVLLCDLMMPGKSGADFYGALAHERPDLAARVTFMSGGGANERLDDFRRTVDRPILRKPLEPEAVLAWVDQQLAATAG